MPLLSQSLSWLSLQALLDVQQLVVEVLYRRRLVHGIILRGVQRPATSDKRVLLCNK